MMVGHTGIGCQEKNGTVTVFDYVGGQAYREKTLADWVKDQATECPKDCDWELEDLLLKISEKEANDFCQRLKGRNNLAWDWEGDDEGKDNCNSSVTYDMKMTTHIEVPEKSASWLSIFNNAFYYNRWGKYTAPWLIKNKHVQGKKKTTKHKCTGGGSGAGNG